MIPLRQLFLVDKLRSAAESGEALQLQVIREIIKRIKLVQLERKAVATDGMMVELLERLRADKERELRLIAGHLADARDHLRDSSDETP